MMSACGSNRLNSFSPAGHRLAIKDAPLAPGEEAFNQAAAAELYRRL
jgi:hypothetical protein